MTYTPCGGCGAETPKERCINCHHDFGGKVSYTIERGQLMLRAKSVPESTPNWMRYFYGFAEHAATKSKDVTKVGAALIGPEGEVRLTGFNGPSRGVLDLPERFERPAKYDWINHAEASVIGFAAREGIRTKGCVLYVTHAPCSNCASLIVQAGITKVVYGPGTTSMPPEKFEIGQQMFREAGIICEALK